MVWVVTKNIVGVLCMATSLAKIESKIDSVKSEVSGMRRDLMKVVYSLIGIVGATVGSQFVHSPPWVVISSYIAMFGAFFIIAATIFKWRYIPVWSKVLRLLLSAHMLFSIIARDMAIIFSPPEWYGITINVTFAIISIVLVIIVWNGAENNMER